MQGIGEIGDYWMQGIQPGLGAALETQKYLLGAGLPGAGLAAC
jgi:hypothetical protein